MAAQVMPTTRRDAGIARCRGYVERGSGRFATVFSAASSSMLPPLAGATSNTDVSRRFRATVDATEEAVVNSLFCLTTVTGLPGRTIEALTVDVVLAVLDAPDTRLP
jgi:D-aminopeptidase